jgi:hypothetical protein
LKGEEKNFFGQMNKQTIFSKKKTKKQLRNEKKKQTKKQLKNERKKQTHK